MPVYRVTIHDRDTDQSFEVGFVKADDHVTAIDKGRQKVKKLADRWSTEKIELCAALHHGPLPGKVKREPRQINGGLF